MRSRERSIEVISIAVIILLRSLSTGEAPLPSDVRLGSIRASLFYFFFFWLAPVSSTFVCRYLFICMLISHLWKYLTDLSMKVIEDSNNQILIEGLLKHRRLYAKDKIENSQKDLTKQAREETWVKIELSTEKFNRHAK